MLRCRPLSLDRSTSSHSSQTSPFSGSGSGSTGPRGRGTSRRLRKIASLVAACALAQVGAQCTQGTLEIREPGALVDTFSFVLEIVVDGDADASTLVVELNGVDISDQVSGGPEIFQAQIAPGAPLQDDNDLVVTALRPANQVVTATHHFGYLPVGKASAHRIASGEELIRGPLAHNKVGDYMLQNSRARFAIQDAMQRELYSVGQYGGNLIDAELVGNQASDNFLEIQPSFNVESVVNAQTIDIVNDGQDGTAAILRACGPDDLLDFVNPSTQVLEAGFPFPPLADDRDLEIEACTTYTLAPETDPSDPQNYIRMDTEVFNNEPPGSGVPNPLPLSVGDWLNPAGELETLSRVGTAPAAFAPRANGIGPAVTSSLGALGFVGFDEASGTDYSFVQPNNVVGGYAFISGVLVVLNQDNVVLTLAGVAPKFTVPAGGSRTFSRFFGVGDGSRAGFFELDARLNGVPSAPVSGCVTSGGQPLAGAKVTIGTNLLSGAPATSGNSTEVAAHFITQTGPCPNYAGEIQVGSFQAVAGKAGYPYEQNALTPPIKTFFAVPGLPGVANFDLPAPGQLAVQVTDELGQPMPARITVVGFDPSPEPLRAGPALGALGSSTLGLLNDSSDRLPFGLAAVAYADHNGSAQIPLEPGSGLYHVYVSRGSEYSAFRTAVPVTIDPGVTTTIQATLVAVVDTPGFVSSDFHVHGIRSADSRVSDLHRVESYSAEGIENLVMTDHHVHTDLSHEIGSAGLSPFLTSTIGEEITSFDYGHFNAYPLLVDANSPTATLADDGTVLSGGSTDWAGAAPPGMDFPSFGAFNAPPAEIFALATAGPLSTPTTTVQINHISSHFEPLRIDTSLVPPADGLTDAQRLARRLPDTASVPNLYFHFPALELWNGDDRGAQGQFLNDRIGVWFNLLNQGLATTFIADTDSHTFTNLNSAGARTWTASPTDAPDDVDPADVASAVTAGRAVGGQGIYVQTELRATDGSGNRASLALGSATTMSDAAGNVELAIEIQSPTWAQWDRVEIYANAATSPAGSPYLFGATPTRVLDEGDCDPATTGDGDFDITTTSAIGGVAGADRLSASLTESFSGLASDTWFVVVVRGTDGECAPMFPIYPDNVAAAGNASLADLVDGNVGEGGVMALGATNALYFVP